MTCVMPISSSTVTPWLIIYATNMAMIIPNQNILTRLRDRHFGQDIKRDPLHSSLRVLWDAVEIDGDVRLCPAQISMLGPATVVGSKRS